MVTHTPVASSSPARILHVVLVVTCESSSMQIPVIASWTARVSLSRSGFCGMGCLPGGVVWVRGMRKSRSMCTGVLRVMSCLFRMACLAWSVIVARHGASFLLDSMSVIFPVEACRNAFFEPCGAGIPGVKNLIIFLLQ